MKLTSILMTVLLASCGSAPKVEKVKDEILGKKRTANEFRLNASLFNGIYLINSIKSQEHLNTVWEKSIPQNLLQVWKISPSTVDIYRAGEGQIQCGERVYSVEENATLRLAATHNCQEEKIEVLAQTGDYSFVSRIDPITINTQNYNLIEMRNRHPSEISQALFTWNSDFINIPEWLKPYAPIENESDAEAKTEAMEAARNSFKNAAIPGKTLSLTGNYQAIIGVEDPQVSVVMFINGSARHWSKVGSDHGKPACYLVFPDNYINDYVNGLTAKIESIEVAHPRRELGKWTLEKDGTEHKSVNEDRSNTVSFKLENVPETVAFFCSLRPDQEVISFEDVLSALGTIGSIK